MIHQEFQEVATRHNAKYNLLEYKVDGIPGSKIPIDEHILQIYYREVVINVKFEFGNHNLAEFDFELPHSGRIPDFTIQARDFYERLFSFNKSRWRIKCKDELFKPSLLALIENGDFSELAKREAFEPTLSGSDVSGILHFKIFYSLSFNNKEQSLKIVVDFTKAVIDYFMKRFVM